MTTSFFNEERISDVLGLPHEEVASKLDRYIPEFAALYLSSRKWTEFADKVSRWLPKERDDDFILKIIAIGKVVDELLRSTNPYKVMMGFIEEGFEKGIIKVIE